MKKVLLGLFVVLLLNVNVSSKDNKKNVHKKTVENIKSISSNKPIDNNISETFHKFILDGVKPIRGEFETKQDYEKRLPGKCDTNKVYCFKITDENLIFEYKYNIDEELLSFKIGRRCFPSLYEYPERYSSPLMIETEILHDKSYIAKNGFGQEVKVNKMKFIDYVLYLKNYINFNNLIYDNSLNILTYTIKIDPKSAEKLSENVEIYFYVRFLDYTLTKSMCYNIHEPTFNDPSDYSSFVRIIESVLDKVVIYNKLNNTIIDEIICK